MPAAARSAPYEARGADGQRASAPRASLAARKGDGDRAQAQASSASATHQATRTPDGPPLEARAHVAEFLDTWCVDCHSGDKPKGALDLEALNTRLRTVTPADAAQAATDRSLLRVARRRVAAGQMPPPKKEERPSPAEVARAMHTFDGVLRPRDPALPPPGGAPRRLNRAEYANTVRDLLGVDVARFGTLAPDDVGGGFDNVAAVLSMAPSSFERMLEMAEAIAADACPEGGPSKAGAAPEVRTIAGRALQVTKGAGMSGKDGAALWSNGQAQGSVQLPRDGVYAVRCVAYGMQAGPEAVKLALMVDGKSVAEVEVPEVATAPGTRRVETTLKGGKRALAVAFLNDYYLKAGPDGKAADRNAMVLEISVEGPLDARPTPAWRVEMDAACAGAAPAARERAAFAFLAGRFLRRTATEEDIAFAMRVADAAGAAQADGAADNGNAASGESSGSGRKEGSGGGAARPAAITGATPRDSNARMRAVIAALLVHPEFLFRIEREVPAGAPPRALDGDEIATRLSYFLWASTPDDALRTAAARGLLATPAGRRAAVDRLLADPRASSLAERFAAQWLGIDGIEQRTPDPAQFPGVDPALLAAMRAETVLFFDSVLREGRPVWTLLDADYTFVDERLARHYGMPLPKGGGMRRVPADAARGGGVLAHASVLTATSNPTRTSPVKRGKWVLEALLDDAPPPPPPGTPQLPERTAGHAGTSMRDLLAAHRADPSCAACHRTMDALGFAFEAYDPVGRRRDRTDGAAVDARGDLPDGRVVVDIAGVRRTLLGDRAFLRSVVKHLMVYATGRAAEPEDDAALDSITDSLGARPTLADIVAAIVESPSFRMRGAS